jgi:hypothetical protein
MMTRIFLRSLIGLGVLLCGMQILRAAPQSATVEPMQQVVDSLQARVARLEAALARLESPTALLETDSVEYIAGRAGAVYLPRQSLGGRLPLPLPVPAAQPAPSANPALELSGYFEGRGRMDPKDGRNNTAGLNQAELDLSRDLGNHVCADLGLYYSGEFSVCWATCKYTALAAREDEPSRRLLQDLSFTAGQFDVPFGFDYQCYAPLDRSLVTMPHSVAASYGWWNDVGVMTEFGGAPGTLSLYAVKGLATTVWNSAEAMPEDVTPDDDRWLALQPAMSGGLRLDLTPCPHVDGGLSLTRGWSRRGAATLSMGGLHLQRSTEHLTLKAEGILAAKAEDLQPQRMRGAYFEATERFGRPFLAQRVDYLRADGETREQGFCLGAGYKLTDGVECRSEYGWNTAARSGEVFLQLVAGF